MCSTFASKEYKQREEGNQISRKAGTQNKLPMFKARERPKQKTGEKELENIDKVKSTLIKLQQQPPKNN
ncbi:Hypothetical predicted protein [Podarcis lilfordi]|uniref:Uncharacterized protein n=1 Tax=Podarcis lilfordi TaxID=74358 RepID=A0AA35K5Y8_9SAUR|nr:Hypothetical predicted protein [Podarcis lilfordi]